MYEYDKLTNQIKDCLNLIIPMVEGSEYRKINKVKPKLHCFGHIHEACGQLVHNDIHYVNASNMDINYNLVNPPIDIILK